MASPSARAWQNVAAEYDRSLGRLCGGIVPALLARLGPAEGRSLLDAGTGSGRVADALARAGFRVDAVDPQQSMIDFADAHYGGAAGQGSTERVIAVDDHAVDGSGGAMFRVASLPELADSTGQPTPTASYDVGVANFVINHTPDPRAALTELTRVVRPGGTVVVSIWPTGVSALNSLWSEVIERAGVPRPVLPRLAPEIDFPRSADGLRAILDEARLSRVDVTEERWDFVVTPDDLWSTATAGLAVIGAVYRHHDGVGQARLSSEFASIAGDRARGGVLRFPMTAVVGIAQAS